MRLRSAVTFSLAALAISGSAKAAEPPAQDTTSAVVQSAALTLEVAQLASNMTVASVAPVPAVIAKPTPAERASARLAGDVTAARRKHPKDKFAEDSDERQQDAAEPNAMCVRPIGRVETGTAAWYGGRYVGRRTSSGSPLDTIHATAAHRTLPLNSLARVTNLDNGRSVVVRVTDRGPVSASLLIDMSPRAAEELNMMHAGLVPVMVEQVVEAPPDSK